LDCSSSNIMSRPELSVIVPAFNEAHRIGPTLRAVTAWLADNRVDAEVLVVDDGSNDSTVAVARAVPGVTVVETSPNRGKGHAVRTGMLAARGELRLFMDADNATPISELPRLRARLADGADIAIGSRRAPGARTLAPAPLHRRLWSRLANKVIRGSLTPGILDTQCGFKLFDAEAAVAVFSLTVTDGWSFDLEVLARARRLGYRIDEVAVTWTDDPRSKISPLRDAIAVTREFLRIRRLLDAGHPVVAR
jgi:dolichyl-phosphate beta-glucosyltransferase